VSSVLPANITPMTAAAATIAMRLPKGRPCGRVIAR
jgi:hypothetical protein